MRHHATLLGIGFALALLVAIGIPSTAAQSGHPCDGVEPGGRCEIEQDCSPPVADEAGRRTSTCTYPNGDATECDVYAQENGSDLYACPNVGMSTQAAGPGLAAWIGGGAAVVLGAGWLVYLRSASRLLVIPALPLFSRVEKASALDHPRRQAVYQFIETHPGVRFHVLRRELELSNGDLRHHLRILQLQGLVIADRRFRRVSFHLPGARPVPELEPQAAALLLLLKEREVSLEAARTELGWTRAKARHWARKLLRLGLLEQRRLGRERWMRSVMSPVNPTTF